MQNMATLAHGLQFSWLDAYLSWNLAFFCHSSGLVRRRETVCACKSSGQFSQGRFYLIDTHGSPLPSYVHLHDCDLDGKTTVVEMYTDGHGESKRIQDN